MHSLISYKAYQSIEPETKQWSSSDNHKLMLLIYSEANAVLATKTTLNNTLINVTSHPNSIFATEQSERTVFPTNYPKPLPAQCPSRRCLSSPDLPPPPPCLQPQRLQALNPSAPYDANQTPSTSSKRLLNRSSDQSHWREQHSATKCSECAYELLSNPLRSRVFGRRFLLLESRRDRTRRKRKDWCSAFPCLA